MDISQMKRSILGPLLALFASGAIAATPVTVTGPSGNQATVSGGSLSVTCTSGCSGGGGGGAVTIASGGVASGAYSAGSLGSGAGVDGWNLTEGTKADSAYAGSGSASIVAALKGIYSGVTGAIPAGSAIIGKVGIDQTTPGTTNLVQIGGTLPAFASTPTFNCGTGCSGSGGSSLADEGTYTQGTTSFTVAGCFYASSITNLTTGQGGAFQCTNSRKLITSSEGATGSSVSANGDFIGGGAAGGAGNLTGATVKPPSTAAASTDTSLVIDANPGGALVAAVNAGVATPGSAVVTNSIQIAGSDGTNARTISTNTSGSQIVAGRTATGSALADNPVLIAGSDGTDVRNISTNSSGQQVIVGAGTAGSTSGGVLTVQGADPCSQTTKQTADFESTSSGGNFITGTSGKITYICSLRITVSTLTNISLCEATSTACSGGTPAAVYMNTGTTAANGASLGQSSTVGGGLIDNGGGTTIAKTATTGQNVDVLFTTTNTPQVNAHATYVQE